MARFYAARIRYPDPAIKVNDTVKIDLSTGKITDFIRFDTAVVAMATGGRNMGRVGVITHRERHDGGFNIVHIKDAIDNSFATRESNVFVIGREKPWISLPKGKGVKVKLSSGYEPSRGYMLTAQLDSLQLRKREIGVVRRLSPTTREITVMTPVLVAKISHDTFYLYGLQGRLSTSKVFEQK